MQPFDRQEVYYGRHRHKRALPEYIKSNAHLNQIINLSAVHGDSQFYYQYLEDNT